MDKPSIVVGEHTKLQPVDTRRLNIHVNQDPLFDNTSPKHRLRRSRSLSPNKPGLGLEKISPIRRSGSPVRRQQIHEIEQEHSRRLKRKQQEETSSSSRSRDSSEPNEGKRVKFNTDVEYFENNSLLSPKLVTHSTKAQTTGTDAVSELERLSKEVEEIKRTQQVILKKLDFIIGKLA